jgi:endoglucanase
LLFQHLFVICDDNIVAMKKIVPFLLTFLLIQNSFAVPPGLTLNTNIRLNQIGFYPLCSKVGIVAGNPAAGNFTIRLNSDASVQFTGTLGASATWSFSNEIVRAADFSAFNKPGTYVMEVGGTCSYPFVIANTVFHDVNRASIKAYYMQRSSTAITAANGGVYARAAGHPDNAVVILPSAINPTRTAGQTFAAPKGWYDAGDYNSYIVNSGISTYTLLATYEHFSTYFDTLNLNIPESGDAVPDLLDEIKWNLDWMLTMQDPADGGVYNKKTNANFDGFIMPSAATTTRYFCAKGTAATFDFAAVMAVAYRIYKPFNLTFANQCLAAAQSAYSWGLANPNIAFNNPGASGAYPAVVTGGYGDGNFSDEKEWASNELYIATLNNATYYVNGFNNGNSYNIPSWPNVNTLGLISLVFNRKKLNATGFLDTTNMKTKLLNLATPLQTYQSTASAYQVAMGQGGAANDFNWGSNSQAANQGMILLTAYEVNKTLSFWIAALANLDYLLGRNATTYSFITGYGSKTPMDPHHRISNADGVVNPVPGWLVGGPQNQNNSDGCAYTGTQPATKYLDNVCSYTTNEIAINWNAPFVFLSAAIEVLNPCSPLPLPVTLLNFEAYTENNNISVKWTTTNEINNDYFDIERSSDGINFIKICSVNAKGEKEGITNYSFIDSNPLEGNSYYRLLQHDLNGMLNYSYIRSVYLKEPEINVYPNPNNGIFTLEIASVNQVSIVIHNLMGQKVTEENISTKEGKKIFDLQNINKGVYFITITLADKVITKKLILQ